MCPPLLFSYKRRTRGLILGELLREEETIVIFVLRALHLYCHHFGEKLSSLAHTPSSPLRHVLVFFELVFVFACSCASEFVVLVLLVFLVFECSWLVLDARRSVLVFWYSSSSLARVLTCFVFATRLQISLHPRRSFQGSCFFVDSILVFELVFGLIPFHCNLLIGSLKAV